MRQFHHDGQKLVVSSQWSLAKDGHDGIPTVAEVSQDITEHSRIRMRHALLADVVESSEDAIIIKRLDGTITDMNPAAEKLFGYAAEELVGRPIYVVFPPELVEQERLIIDRVRHGERVENFETVRRRKDGSLVEVSLSVSPVHDDGGTVVGAAKIVRDITEQNANRRRVHDLQASLAHLGRLTTMGQMASSLAHELNQPLTALGNYLSAANRLAARDPLDREQLRSAIVAARQQAARTGEVVKHLRSFVEMGGTGHRPVNLSQVVSDGVELGALDAKRHRVTIALHLAEDIGPLLMDRVQLGQVVVNLVRNAVEAMQGSERRELEVATVSVAEDQAVEITVSDTGPGIPREVDERLFQPFVMSKPTGMGIGLSICRELIEAHGGWINAAARPGGGTVFTVHLPASSGDEKRVEN